MLCGLEVRGPVFAAAWHSALFPSHTSLIPLGPLLKFQMAIRSRRVTHRQGSLCSDECSCAGASGSRGEGWASSGTPRQCSQGSQEGRRAGGRCIQGFKGPSVQDSRACACHIIVARSALPSPGGLPGVGWRNSQQRPPGGTAQAAGCWGRAPYAL